jgi:hypothetical protein
VTARISDESSHQPVDLNCHEWWTFDRPFITRTVSSQTNIDQTDFFSIVGKRTADTPKRGLSAQVD